MDCTFLIRPEDIDAQLKEELDLVQPVGALKPQPLASLRTVNMKGESGVRFVLKQGKTHVTQVTEKTHGRVLGALVIEVTKQLFSMGYSEDALGVIKNGRYCQPPVPR